MVKLCILFRVRYIIFFSCHACFKKETVLCLLHAFPEFICPKPFYKFIWVFIRLHINHPCINPCLPEHRNCTECRFPPCLVTVISKEHFICIPFNNSCLLYCKCSTKRCNSISKACLLKGNYINISLTEYHILILAKLCIIKSKKISAFIKQLCFRRIKVFWLRITHNPSSKTYNPAVYIHYWKYYPVKELVIDTPFIHFKKSCFFKDSITIPFMPQEPVQFTASLSCIPKPEMPYCLICNSSGCKVFISCLALWGLKLCIIIPPCFPVYLKKLHPDAFLFFMLLVHFPFLKGYSCSFCKCFHSFLECIVLIFHNKCYYTAACTTAKAFIHLPCGVY